MPTCPRGHQSTAADYCDECGTPIGGAAAPAPSTGPAASTPSGPRAPTGEPCPQCATPRTGRFCEVCGHDFLAAELSPPGRPEPDGRPPSNRPVAAGGQPPLGGPLPPINGPRGSAGQGGPAGQGAAEGQGGAAGQGKAADGASPEATAATGWRAVVTADAAYHARMQAVADPEAEPIAFPAFCPERRFALQGPQVLIGRQSRSRGIEPNIDLTGPPADPAVSHAHAMLVAQPDGGWALVDLGSANGTYLNDGADAIEQNVPVPLSDGDRIHLGAFSTLTLHRT
jgi:hypothetical protein